MCFERRPCVHGSREAHSLTRGVIPYPHQDWDPSRIYRQVVILISFSDEDFSMDDPHAYYHDLLNVSGPKDRGGVGCVADYFRDQSSGIFNLQFDVIGPVRVSESAQGSGSNYGEKAIKEALKKAVDSLQVDFTPYDWDGDGEVEQVVCITAGYCANGGPSQYKRYVWPNTGSMSRVNLTGGKYATYYSVSAEKWYNEIGCGIGTICHEYSHCLGLPDLYPTNSVVFSVVDEWDLMDGGNYTGWGWCPPNYSAFEKYLLGWLSFEDLTEPCTVSGLMPVAEGGVAYRMVEEGDHIYVLENRQRSGWDQYLPGQGLLIADIDYSQSKWEYNNVNTSRDHFCYQFEYADGMDYVAWDNYIKNNGLTEYVDDADRLWRHHLSTTPYPLVTDTIELHECTSLPMPLTNIQLSADGSISFDVVSTGIPHLLTPPSSLLPPPSSIYDMQGHRYSELPSRPGIYIIRYENGNTIKILL